MVKYPVQSVLGGTLLLGLAFSLNDGSAVETQKTAAITRCQPQAGESFGPQQVESLSKDGCVHLAAKK